MTAPRANTADRQTRFDLRDPLRERGSSDGKNIERPVSVGDVENVAVDAHRGSYARSRRGPIGDDWSKRVEQVELDQSGRRRGIEPGALKREIVDDSSELDGSHQREVIRTAEDVDLRVAGDPGEITLCPDPAGGPRNRDRHDRPGRIHCGILEGDAPGAGDPQIPAGQVDVPDRLAISPRPGGAVSAVVIRTEKTRKKKKREEEQTRPGASPLDSTRISLPRFPPLAASWNDSPGVA